MLHHAFSTLGALKGKKATVWPSEKTISLLEDSGAVYCQKEVVRDNNIITANGPESSKPFTDEILAIL